MSAAGGGACPSAEASGNDSRRNSVTAVDGTSGAKGGRAPAPLSVLPPVPAAARSSAMAAQTSPARERSEKEREMATTEVAQA